MSITDAIADSHTLDSLLAALTELKAKGTPGNTLVVLSSDASAQDNGCSPLPLKDGVDVGMYMPNQPWCGDHYMTEPDRLSRDDADAYDPAPPGALLAVFLWPTN